MKSPRERNSRYLGWVASLPCVACMTEGKTTFGVHVAHLRMGSIAHDKRETGMAEKPSDRWTTPLCPSHHVNGNKAQHHFGEDQFWREIGIDPFALCKALWFAYDAGKSGLPIIARIAGEARRRKVIT